MNVRAAAQPRLFTVGEYHRMSEVGIFKEDDRVELIEGEVVAMSPIGSRHAACVKKLSVLMRNLIGDVTIVGVQDPIQLDDRSEPQPDLSILRPREDFYAAAHPGSASVLLLVEVADASIMVDRTMKIPLYARSGIAEVWLVDLVKNVVETYSQPDPAGYAQSRCHERGATVVSSVLPALQIPVSEILIG